MDLSGYDAYLSGKLEPYELPDSELVAAEECLKQYPKGPCA